METIYNLFEHVHLKFALLLLLFYVLHLGTKVNRNPVQRDRGAQTREQLFGQGHSFK